MSTGTETHEWLDAFRDEAILTHVIRLVRSGKEATVYQCAAHPAMERDFVAAKVYRDRKSRSFKDDAVYQEGQAVYRIQGAGRIVRAMNRKSSMGEVARASLWADREYEVLETLYGASSSVPEPLACEGTTLVMEFVGDESGAAPQLREVNLGRGEAQDTCDTLVDEVRRWLGLNLVHGDLSEYNVLYHEGRPVVIDFPQTVDPRFNGHARRLLGRDLANIARFCNRFGATLDAEAVADDLWRNFQLGRL